jgi:hypothetical protein
VFTLYTCNYSSFESSMGTPIQTSRGYPKWPLRYALDVRMSELMPDRGLWGLPVTEYVPRYRAQLDQIEVEALAAKFTRIAESAAETRLVLMCFENLAKPDQFCHRTVFAEWWRDQSGQPVPELGPTLP